MLEINSFADKHDAIEYALDHGWQVNKVGMTTIARKGKNTLVLNYDKELWFSWKST